MSRLLIYLSFMSLPGAEELGMLTITYAYIALALAAPLLVALFRPSCLSSAGSAGTAGALTYLCLLAGMLPVNFVVGHLNGVDSLTWLSRSAHLLVMPTIFLCFTLEGVRAEVLFKDICVVGAIETLMVYIAALFFQDDSVDEFRRATDIEGVIVYSVFMVCTGFHAVRQFERTRSAWWLLGYVLVLMAAVLTGTRVLILTIGALLLALRLRPTTLLALAVVATVGVVLGGGGLFERFNLSDDENLVTILSKVEELQWLSSFFLANPLLGVGFGKAYQVSLASSEYTYSHNMVLFYLGYGGLVGCLLALYPLARLLFVRGAWVLVVAVFIFYTSATTYTNLKHSLFIMVALLVATQYGTARMRAQPSRPPWRVPRPAHE